MAEEKKFSAYEEKKSEHETKAVVKPAAQMRPAKRDRDYFNRRFTKVGK